MYIKYPFVVSYLDCAKGRLAKQFGTGERTFVLQNLVLKGNTYACIAYLSAKFNFY